MGPTWDMPPQAEVTTRRFATLKASADLMTQLGDAFAVRPDVIAFIAANPTLDPAAVIEVTPTTIKVKN